MSDSVQDGRKRNKRKYGGPQAGGKRRRGGRELEPGMQGILITCNMKERRCTAEAYSLLNEYADQLYGPEQLADPNDSCSEDDVEAALQKEVKQFHSTTENQQRRFTALESGANNVLFIRTHNIDPGELVHSVLQDLYSTRRLKSRVILRMLPVCGSCRAFPEDMLKFLHSFLQPWFLSPNHASYQICFKSRNNSHSKRDDIIKSIAGLVNRLNPKNKVDLTNPELSIIIEVIKSVCCVSVIRDYKRFRKYNLQEVAKGPATQESSQQEVAEDPAIHESSQQKVAKDSATQESSPQEVAKDSATEESSPQEVAKDSATEESSPQEVAKDSATQESSPQEVAKDSATEESSPQEVAKDSATQESSPQEVAKDSATQESSPQEVAKDSATQESSPQEVVKDSATQESSPQEVGKNEANEEQGEQEVPKDLTSQEQGQQEVAESKANQTEEQNVGGDNGIKEAEQE
ncbi:hypothetical protein PHYPO_G00156510 [Pangasianodon hypophthalmus]|uniref:THUMP domain-containing protein 1 n=1 Tax=Pangasianodon hypophthalmus TaxID=310915 RepID=A0A5N5K072_PANHP|nr:hypothetical protein PHYPO_G00156510 [Pangasianodon hypophthalmus]